MLLLNNEDLKEVLNPFNYTGKDRNTLIYVKGRKTPDIE